jgi:hypothetical protein
MATRNGSLGVHEEIMLLALHDEKGTVASGTWYNLALGGAILSELLLRGIVEVESAGKKSFLKLLNKKFTGDDALDAAIEKISKAKRRATLETWVSRLSGIRDLRHRVARLLCKREILRADEKQILLFFKQRIYPERNHGPEQKVIARLSDAIFGNGQKTDPRTIVLLSLAHSSDLLKVLFDKKELKSRKSHIEQLADGNTLGDATKAAVQSAQAAIMVATMIPVITTTVHS